MYEYDASYALPGTVTHSLHEYKKYQKKQAKKAIRETILRHNMVNKNMWSRSQPKYSKLLNTVNTNSA